MAFYPKYSRVCFLRIETFSYRIQQLLIINVKIFILTPLFNPPTLKTVVLADLIQRVLHIIFSFPLPNTKSNLGAGGM